MEAVAGAFFHTEVSYFGLNNGFEIKSKSKCRVFTRVRDDIFQMQSSLKVPSDSSLGCTKQVFT